MVRSMAVLEEEAANRGSFTDGGVGQDAGCFLKLWCPHITDDNASLYPDVGPYP